MSTVAEVLSRHDLDESVVAAGMEGFLEGIEDGPAVASLTEADMAVLTEAGAVGDTADLSRSRARAAGAYGALVAESLSVDEAAERCGIDASRVRHRLAEHRLYGFKVRGRWRLPRWQFVAPGVILPGVEDVAAYLVKVHPLEAVGFLTTRQPELQVEDEPVSPLAWLRQGRDPAPLVALARWLDRLV